ncbi:hypothetical protein TNIN_281121 [Trichonephila inaurata madagascariensis]|uniref:Uncharacterized protein n=1 Tax=Trichonephila inaurata madagascariensis TaxID=2747483 RepID=A0A8X7CP89_9ARAC|nr:hypothetical protein TNIN_281121 [Trichonephila inaurata madagascariensis]
MEEFNMTENNYDATLNTHPTTTLWIENSNEFNTDTLNDISELHAEVKTTDRCLSSFEIKSDSSSPVILAITVKNLQVTHSMNNTDTYPGLKVIEVVFIENSIKKKLLWKFGKTERALPACDHKIFCQILSQRNVR